MTRDLRYAAQTLLRNPLFTATATLALGLAIGANAAIFGLIDALWFRPPGVHDPGRLVRVFATTPTEARALWSFPEYVDIREHVAAFSGVIARGRRGALLSSPDGSPELVLVNVVSTNFFTALSVTALHGRVFTDADVQNPEATAVLGHAFWQSRFGGDPSIVGRTIPLGRSDTATPVTVLGVLPPEFRELEPAADRDVWLPPFTWRQLAGNDEFQNRASRWFDVAARLAPGASRQTAHAQTSALAASFAQQFPDDSASRGALVITDFTYRLGNGGATAGALLALVLLVVVITCVNIANLLFARAESRAGELAIRAAVGASRWRIARQLIAECMLLGVFGAVAGLTLGAWIIRLLPAIMGAPPGFRSFLLFQTDWRVIGFTAATTMITTVLFGIAPSWLSTRTNAAPLLKGGAGLVGSGSSRNALRYTLATAQIAVSLVLLCAAGVLVRSFVETQRADIGFERRPLLTAWGSREAPVATAREAVGRLNALPGVQQTAVAIRAPLSLSGGGMARPVFLPHAPADTAGLPAIKFNAVSSNYFEVFGTRVLRGRAFTDDDQRGGTPVMVVNERFADQFFRGRDPMNAIVRVGGERGTAHRIVGVVQNAVINAIGETPEPYFYFPYWSGDYGEITYVLQSAVDPGSLSLAVRDTLRRLDSRLEPQRVIAMREYIEHASRVYQITALLAAALGGIGLVLTALGVYGVIAYRMMRRARELAIRVAIGAAPRQLLSMTAREGIRLLAAGAAVGIPAALLTTKQMMALLFGVAPWDVVSFLAASVVLFLVVGTATLIPAWRATRVNPSAVLR